MRSSPEKILTLMYPDLQPPTLITRDTARARIPRRAWRHRAEAAARAWRGRRAEDRARTAISKRRVDLFNKMVPEPFIAQAFLPAVSEGDKRILIVDGEPVGAINRKPPEGAIRSNLVVGGDAEATELSAREQEICARIGPELKSAACCSSAST